MPYKNLVNCIKGCIKKMDNKFINFEVLITVNECLKNEELVNEYCRLKGIKRPDKLSPIEEMIDKACGYDANKEFMEGFIEFVYEYVYKTMPSVDRYN